MRGVRAAVGAMLAVAAAGLVAGCDPVYVADTPDSAKIWIEVNPEGSAFTSVMLDDGEHSRDDLIEAGRAASTSLTNSAATSEVEAFRDAAGHWSAWVNTAHAFSPGASPTIEFDTTEAVAYLLDQGVSSISVTLVLPPIKARSLWQPASASDGATRGYWPNVTSADSAPRGTIDLEPAKSASGQVWLAMLSPFGATLALALAWILLIKRRRVPAIVFGGLACFGFVVDPFVVDGPVAAINLAALGGSEWPSRTVLLLIAASLSLGLIASLVAVALGAAGVPRPYVAFTPPPGWPAMPDGWLPFDGWQPVHSWPQAPPRWNFLRSVPKSGAHGNTSSRARAAARLWQANYRLAQQAAARPQDEVSPKA